MSSHIAQERPLRAFASGHPAVVSLDGAHAVVLAATDEGDVEIWSSGTVRRYSTSTPVEPLRDPDLALAALHEAALSLNDLRREVTTAAAAESQAHATQLANIRLYAIDAYLDGSICDEGLEAFLSRFGLESYDFGNGDVD